MILKDLVWDTMKRLQTHIQPSILHFQLYITKMHWVKHVQDWTTVFSSSWFSFSVSYHRKWLILHLWWKVCGDHDWNWKCRRGKDGVCGQHAFTLCGVGLGQADWNTLWILGVKSLEESSTQIEMTDEVKGDGWALERKGKIKGTRVWEVYCVSPNQRTFNEKRAASRISGLPWWLSGKESACQCRRHRFNPWSRKIPRAGGQHMPICHNYWGHLPTFWSLCTLEPVRRNKRSHHSEKPVQCNWE